MFNPGVAAELDPSQEFFDAIRNPLTRKKYEKRLALFFTKIKIEGNLRQQARAFLSKAKSDRPDFAWATYQINEYIRFQKSKAEKNEISESTLPNYFKPIKLFCQENDIILNWKKISRRIPKGRHYANDRTPSIEEVKTILSYPDRRIKPIVLIMASCGCRIGAFDYLKWGDIEPIDEGGLKLAKITIYAGENEQYYTFNTPECYREIKEYIDYRKEQGERITKDSPLIRDLIRGDRWGNGESHISKRLKSSAVKHVVEDALRIMGVRKKLEENKRTMAIAPI